MTPADARRRLGPTDRQRGTADDPGSPRWGVSGLQWIVAGYTLMFWALQLFLGTPSDRSDARRAYRLGMAVFALASLTCSLAPARGVLIAGRVVQGFGAAMITPTSLALIREAYEDATAHRRPSEVGTAAR